MDSISNRSSLQVRLEPAVQAKGKPKVENPQDAKTARVASKTISESHKSQSPEGIIKATTHAVGKGVKKAADLGRKIFSSKPMPHNASGELPLARRQTQREIEINRHLDASNKASFTESSSRFFEASNPKEMFQAFKSMSMKFNQLAPSDKELYQADMNSAKAQVRESIQNDPNSALNQVTEKGTAHTKNVFGEIKSTEQTFLNTIRSVQSNLKTLVDNNILSRDDFNALNEGWAELEKAVSENVLSFSILTDPNVSDADKMKAVLKQIDLKGGSALRTGLEKLVKSYNASLEILSKYEGKIPAQFQESFLAVKNGIITPVQRGPRYEMLLADLSKKHPDPILQQVAAHQNSEIASNMREINKGL